MHEMIWKYFSIKLKNSIFEYESINGQYNSIFIVCQRAHENQFIGTVFWFVYYRGADR